MLEEFKKFAIKGNVMDLAIGVIIGGAFGKIVTSLVNDMIMPVLGVLIGKVDFANKFIVLGEFAGTKFLSLAQAKDAGATTLSYGLFINTIIEFLIISFSIFIVIRQINKLNKKEEVVVEKTTKNCPYCHTEIPKAASRCPNCTSVLE